MPINPPSSPTFTLRESTYADDGSLALQTIAAEQALSNLQALSGAASQVGLLAAQQRATSEATNNLRNELGRVRNEEAQEVGRVRREIASATDTPANSANLESFLRSRGLPSNLTTSEGRQAAIDGLDSYEARVRNNFSSVNNPGIRARIAGDADLQQALEDSGVLLNPPGPRGTPAQINTRVERLATSSQALLANIQQQVAALLQLAQAAQINSENTTQLSQSLVTAVQQSQLTDSDRRVNLENELRLENDSLNRALRDLEIVSRGDLQAEQQLRLTSIVDRVNTTVDRLRLVILGLLPTAAIRGNATATSVDGLQRDLTANSLQTTSNSLPNVGLDSRPTRLRDPNRLV